ncbi:MAG: hypothetical protein G3M78_14660 [Candidatus Nitrohelix vancouverensis]|uniref:PpiC domain-containing protein n=1 Tax=Candidatus Nitrohelix vancouverensis TaxID=2705534 RepID=A0A7T0G4K0_9BACT|nr:MAG: hypothetical protein G3M78_14660 [Candidatus Nitrohelix vancouverensis]
MSDKEFPEESKDTVYERDKTAKEPVVPAPSAPVKPKPKPRKVFVAKKVKLDKPMERRVRHILISTKEAAAMFRDTLLEFQKELAEKPSEEAEKEYEDWKKLENLFSRLAKKYSCCTTKTIGGSLDWIYKDMPISEHMNVLNPELVEAIMEADTSTIPEPVKSPSGYHLIMICETQIHTPRVKNTGPSGPTTKSIPGVPN